ncbi:MAG: putative permease [Gammaproteobacteria bacterium]|jgi:putative permease
MLSLVRNWFARHLSDPQVIGLAFVLIIGFVLVYAAGDMLTPVIASVIIAYLLEGVVTSVERRRVPRFAAVVVVFVVFMAGLVFFIFGLLPLLSRQATQLVNRLPDMLSRGQELLLNLPERYPDLITSNQVLEIISTLRLELLSLGQQAVSMSLSSLVGIITVLVYLVLMPLMLFFFLKDKGQIIAWFQGFLPQDRKLIGEVWRDVDVQIANYVRGKFIEIMIVGVATYVAFLLLNLQFALLLGVVNGLSVLIPYIGATVVTFPIALVALFQFGFTSEFAWLMGAYLVIQALDGNVLVPLLFSEVVNLHPIAIIVAILLFGGLWGFWGVFFAIPLATLVQAVLKAWPILEAYPEAKQPTAATVSGPK